MKSYSELVEEELARSHTIKCGTVRAYILSARRRGEEIADLLGSRTALEGKRALDVGTGDGGAAIALSGRGCSVTAFDNSWGNLLRARQLARESGVNPSFVVMDAEHAGLAPRRFDLIILADVLEHVANPDKVIRIVAESMKPGAICYVTVPNRLSPWNVLREQHYHLFGLSLMPQWLASFYVTRVRKRSRIYALRSSFSWRSLKRLLAMRGIELASCGELRTVKRLDKPELLIDPAQRFLVKVVAVMRLKPLVKALFHTRLYQQFLAPVFVCVGRKKR